MKSTREAIRRALTVPCTLNLQPFLAPPGLGAKANKESRPAWTRVNRILDMLQCGERFNASTLAHQMGTVTKTIHRDLTYLRSVGFKIRYVRGGNYFQITGGGK